MGAAFGSFGWSGEAAGYINEILEDMKVEIIAEPLNIKYVPDSDDLDKCFTLGKSVARKLGELC